MVLVNPLVKMLYSLVTVLQKQCKIKETKCKAGVMSWSVKLNTCNETEIGFQLLLLNLIFS